MKVKTDYDGCRYITAGKEYEVLRTQNRDALGVIVADDGDEIYIRFASCAFLEGKAWTVVEDGE